MSTIKIKSNYNQFIKKFKAKIDDKFANISKNVEKLLSEMCEEMRNEITSNRMTWAEPNSILSQINGNDIVYTLNSDGTGGTIVVGGNPSDTPPIVMSDGRTVNPYMFIEFGFGIVGQENPVRYASSRGWEYNVENHEKGWSFLGIDGEFHGSRGRKGIDFFYNTIEKYRHRWKEILSE